MTEVMLSNGWVAHVSAEGVTLEGADSYTPLTADDLDTLSRAHREAADMVRPLSQLAVQNILDELNNIAAFRERLIVTFIGRDERTHGYVVELHDYRTGTHHICRTVGEWAVCRKALHQVAG